VNAASPPNAATMRRKPTYDPQRQQCYAWERSFRIVEEQLRSISVRKPFTPEFLAFFTSVWEFGYGLYGNAKVQKWPNLIALDRPPRLKFMSRLSRASGHAGFGFDRSGRFLPTITLGFMGMTRSTLLHETAHILTCGDGHGLDFCRVALSLYVRFLDVDERHALQLAAEHGVQITCS
jgi:hypothetical protein